jgi:hypothetical protein
MTGCCSLDHGLRRADFGLADGPGPPQRQDEATHKVILKLLAEEEAKASTLHKQK